jgi:CubicO group peptidase (beta-lactamase class C family)
MRALDLVATWPVPAAAAGVAQPSSGLRVVAGDAGRPYAWASVTKLCSALAVLVAVEERTVALEDPAGPAGATVAHLLAHASGVAPDRPEPIAPVGTRRIYSNAGFELLGELVASRAEMPFGSYVEEAVFAPLGMRGARLPAGASPASGAHGGPDDLLALGVELLAPSVVSPKTLAEAVSVAFPGLPGVLPGYGFYDPCDWGLGFEIRDAKHPHWTGARCSAATFGHFGRSGCFLWVDPAAGVACAALAARPWGPWASVWPDFSDAVLETLSGRPEPGAGSAGPGGVRGAATRGPTAGGDGAAAHG